MISEYFVRRLTAGARRARQRKKDPAKSRQAKRVWRRYRKKIQREIDRFHSSPRGKAFHRALGRVASTYRGTRESAYAGYEEILYWIEEYLISVIKIGKIFVYYNGVKFRNRFYSWDDILTNRVSFTLALIGSIAFILQSDEEVDLYLKFYYNPYTNPFTPYGAINKSFGVWATVMSADGVGLTGDPPSFVEFNEFYLIDEYLIMNWEFIDDYFVPVESRYIQQ